MTKSTKNQCRICEGSDSIGHRLHCANNPLNKPIETPPTEPFMFVLELGYGVYHPKNIDPLGVFPMRKMAEKFVDHPLYANQCEIRPVKTPPAVVDMLLYCPNCGTQHIDAPQPEKNWTNPPHRSHECQSCSWTWRPSDAFTNGVEVIQTKGRRDKSAVPIINSQLDLEVCTKCTYFGTEKAKLCRNCQRTAKLETELEALKKLINTPHTDDFMKSVPLEAAFQVTHWGTEQDAGKSPVDWLFLVGYLAGKACHHATLENTENALHHCVSAAAVLLNWYRRLKGEEMTFRPGIAEIKTINTEGETIEDEKL